MGYQAEGMDADTRMRELDQLIDTALSDAGFADLVEAERRQKLEARRSELTDTFRSWLDHEPDTEELVQPTERVNEQLAEEVSRL